MAVLDRTKEPGSFGEPLYLDVVATLAEAHGDGTRDLPLVTGGRYGLSSKEFTPGMVAGVLEELGREQPRRRFTVGINDDVSGTSIAYDRTLDIEPAGTVRAVFFGLGSDGTVGANKNTIKILAEDSHIRAQGYFVYDSKKSGSQTVSHLRFGSEPIRAPYLVDRASFVACHRFSLLEQVDVLARAAHGATLLLDCPHPPEEVWDVLPRSVQEQILAKGIEPSTPSTPAVSRARPGSPGAPTRCSRRASSRSPACCPATRRSRGSSTRSRRRTAAAGPRSSTRNHAAVDHALEALHAHRGAAAGDGRP